MKEMKSLLSLKSDKYKITPIAKSTAVKQNMKGNSIVKENISGRHVTF